MRPSRDWLTTRPLNTPSPTPNVSKYGLQVQLTRWRNDDPARWSGTVACQRPGLYRGGNSVRGFHQADAAVLRECLKELDQREKKEKSTKPPRPGNNPGRDPDTRRLFLSRKSPTCLNIEDAETIQVISTKKVKVGSMTLRLAWPIPIDTDVRAVNIQERESSTRKGQNRPLSGRSYEINLVVQIPDPEPRPLTAPAIGMDAGITHTLTGSDGEFHDLNIPRMDQLQETVEGLKEHQKRLKHHSRRWWKLQEAIRRANRDSSRIRNNWEHHTSRQIAQWNNLVVLEDLKLNNMRQSARGTTENPGRNVRAKSGLNRGLAAARLGAMRNKLQRQCEKAGAHLVKVNPRYTSTTCSSCGYRDGKNRKSQAESLCGKCGFSANADLNAAINVLRRGIQMVLILAALSVPVAGQAVDKTGRRVGIPPSYDSPARNPTPSGPNRTGPEPERRRAHAVEPKQRLLPSLQGLG